MACTAASRSNLAGLLLLAFAISSCKREPRVSANATSSVPPRVAEEMRTLRQFLSGHPNDPAALFNLALDQASVGQGDSAIASLETMAEAHTGMDPTGGALRGFKSIASDSRFTSLVARIRQENPPVSRSTPMLTIRERDLAPEGIAYDPVGRVF